MNSVTATQDTAVTDESRIQLTLARREVEQLHETLPWLLRALADRPETPARYRARRQKAHALLQRLLEALPPGVTLADTELERR